MKNNGQIHIYTGNGKGKTTAAMGLALRAVGAKQRVCFIQFLKGGTYSEHAVLRCLPGLTFKKFGRDGFIKKKPSKIDYTEAEKALAAVQVAITSGKFDLVVADEILVAIDLGLISEQTVKDCIAQSHPEVEIVLTGRGATPGLKRMANLITEMKPIKHYYQAGVAARRGIEY